MCLSYSHVNWNESCIDYSFLLQNNILLIVPV